jgi:hypothetical protein
METYMLLKAEGSDACDGAVAHWRAMLPFWNVEADRFRARAIAACRSGIPPAGLSDEIEATLEQVRAALVHCDALLGAALPGAHQLPLLVSAAAEFEALLESLHSSLEQVTDRFGHTPPGRSAITITHAGAGGF